VVVSERFVASTRYNDLRGTIAIDEFQAIGDTSYSLLEKLEEYADIPEGFRAVGFEISTAAPMGLEDHGIMSYDVLCLKPEDVGYGADQWRDFASEHGELPVYRFRDRLGFDDFRSLIHRLDVKVAFGSLEGVNIRIHSSMK
jgi:hypothetical protein